MRQKLHVFFMDLPHSDAPFMKAYPAETTEAFLDGHVSAFAYFGGVPQSILYDNTKLAVAKICGDGKRERTRAFSGLVSHYLFRDRFGRPGKGNDKGKVENLVKNGRRRFLTPVPVATSFEALNARLEADCLSELDRKAWPARRDGRGAAGGRSHRVPPVCRLVVFEPCEKRTARVSSTAMVRYRMSDYSVPTAYLIAGDMEKGSMLWSRKIGGPENSQYLSMPPLIFSDVIIYGPAGADWDAKNWIAAFRLDSGEEVWRFQSHPGCKRARTGTWSNPHSREHGGGAVWTPLSLDA